MMNLYTELPPEKQAEVELLLRDIHTLACEKGMESLAESVGRYQGGCEGWKDFLRSDLSVYNKSFVAWLYHRDIFDSAIRYFELDAQSWWKKRVGLPKMTPVFTDSVRSEIEKELENLLWEHQGRGNLCTVEMVERGNGVFYFFAYPDDYVKDSFVHDSTRNLMPQTIRQTFELVFAYDSTEGNAEFSAKAA